MTSTAPSEPRLPPEILDLVLGSLGHPPDRSTRNTLVTCFLVSNSMYSLARRHYFRKLIIKQFIDFHRPLPQREYHLIHVFFHNPTLLGLIQELDIVYDSTYAPDERVRRYRDTDSPISQNAILDRFPWLGPPRPLRLDDMLPLYLLLRQSPIHTTRFILKNSGEGSNWYTTNVNHLTPICSIQSLKRVYFVTMLPASPFGLDGDPVIPTGLDSLELLWVAESEEELDESVPAGDWAPFPSFLNIYQTATFPPSASHPYEPTQFDGVDVVKTTTLL